MSFYLCIGRWSGIRLEVDYLTGIRLYLGWLVLGIVLFHIENMCDAAFGQLNVMLTENYLLASLIKEKLPEDYSKLFVHLQNIDPKKVH